MTKPTIPESRQPCPHHNIVRKSKPFQSTALGVAFTSEWWECGDCGEFMGGISKPWSSMGGCGEPI